MTGLARMAKARGEIARTNEDAVDAFDSRERIERLPRLDLHQKAEFARGALGAALDAAPIRM
jgi:hypothetical protein